MRCVVGCLPHVVIALTRVLRYSHATIKRSSQVQCAAIVQLSEVPLQQRASPSVVNMVCSAYNYCLTTPYCVCQRSDHKTWVWVVRRGSSSSQEASPQDSLLTAMPRPGDSYGRHLEPFNGTQWSENTSRDAPTGLAGQYLHGAVPVTAYHGGPLLHHNQPLAGKPEGFWKRLSRFLLPHRRRRRRR